MFFVGFSTYFTLAFELLFPLFIWNKFYRKFLIFSGIMLHLGIYFFMMIYDFEILFIMIYGFFLTNKQWSKINLWLSKFLVKLNFVKARTI